MQTFLFHYGKEMAGKHIGLIVSSASSGISGVEADAKRLIPAGDFLSLSLWIRSSQTSSAGSLLEEWLKAIDYSGIAAIDTLRDDTDGYIPPTPSRARDFFTSPSRHPHSPTAYTLSMERKL